MDIESPCIGLCRIDPVSKLCEGCFRTIEEIMRWRAMSPEARRKVMDDLPGRAGRKT